MALFIPFQNRPRKGLFFLFMSIQSASFFSFVSGYFFSFLLFTAWHKSGVLRINK
jgi:hypothetical protein